MNQEEALHEFFMQGVFLAPIDRQVVGGGEGKKSKISTKNATASTVAQRMTLKVIQCSSIRRRSRFQQFDEWSCWRLADVHRIAGSFPVPIRPVGLGILQQKQ